MKRDFIHDLTASFSLWFDNRLLTEGEAFTNVSGQLYKTNDPNYASSLVFAGPYKQWVYDSAVPSADIPEGVYYNGSFKDRTFNGLKLDFQNGRAIFSSGSPSATVTAAYARKDFNIYTTTKSDYELLIETSYAINPSIGPGTSGLSADTIVAPCIFIKLKGFQNEELSLGGMDSTTINLRAVILSDDEFKLNGAGNIFVDLYDTNFLIFNTTPPLNRYNDIKNGHYNYLDSVGSGFAPEKLAYIHKVSFSRLNLTPGNTDAAVLDKFPDLHIGFLDFVIKVGRW
jgi:hypothetical protein